MKLLDIIDPKFIKRMESEIEEYLDELYKLTECKTTLLKIIDIRPIDIIETMFEDGDFLEEESYLYMCSILAWAEAIIDEELLKD